MGQAAVSKRKSKGLRKRLAPQRRVKESDPHVDEDCSGCNESLSPLVGPYGSVGPGVAGFFFMVWQGIHSMGLGNHYVGDGTYPDLE
jgi:hypothetical protein